MTPIRLVLDALREMLRGGAAYWRWLGFLAVLVAAGLWAYAGQISAGLVVTGMSDQVSWGFYISNFAFLVGIAAAAVLLVIPAYLFHRQDVKAVVLLGEGLAVSAVVCAMLFVLADLGSPERAWHLIPFIGRFNFPTSLLAWDVVVLNGYLALNLALPLYVHYCHYRNREPNLKLYFPVVVVAMFWAISIHTVTAFLFSANSARPFWNTALLGPRFIASAFASGPALIILVLGTIRRVTDYPVKQSVIDTLALVMTVSLQISLFFVGAELFTDFYNESAHAGSIRYLFLGLGGLGALKPWIWAALAMNVVAVVLLSVHRTRRNPATLTLACVLAFVGIWIEKGMGLVVPGFIPTPLGELFEYSPTLREILVSVGIWALGALIFTLLAKASIAIEMGRVRERPLPAPGAATAGAATAGAPAAGASLGAHAG
jgi:molybdopterin-containing oxidoreductase family membrane subunit